MVQEKMSPPAPKRKKTSKKPASTLADSESDTSLNTSLKRENSHDLDDDVVEDVVLPPKDDLQILLNRIEMQLPKDDHVKYDSRARKLDWEMIKFKEFSAEECKKYWEYIQARIRRFRILAEMIPDARTWLSQPWTNFYKSKDHNRHPEMPKKPLSMYMLYYSERREQIQKDNPNLSMPDVAKICSDEYQKLPQLEKEKYKARCDDMRKKYDLKLENFYKMYPDLKPVKTEKATKSSAAKNNMERAGGVAGEDQAGVEGHEGEEEGQVDQEGHEGVPGLRGAGGRVQSQTSRVQPAVCKIFSYSRRTENS